jgi:hypothetical protein
MASRQRGGGGAAEMSALLLKEITYTKGTECIFEKFGGLLEKFKVVTNILREEEEEEQEEEEEDEESVASVTFQKHRHEWVQQILLPISTPHVLTF